MAMVSGERPPGRVDVIEAVSLALAVFAALACFGLAGYAGIVAGEWGAASGLAFLGVFSAATPRLVGKWRIKAFGNEAEGEFARPTATVITAPQPPAALDPPAQGGPPGRIPESSTESDEG
jgi:hypothetical protein